MSSGMTSEITSKSPDDTSRVGEQIGINLDGGEILELIGDVGSGKTVFVRGLATAVGSADQVTSPTFTISRIYSGEGIEVHHFDFYRLQDPGLMRAELQESVADPEVVVVTEWSDVVADVLPPERLRIAFTPISETSRRLEISAMDRLHAACIGEMS
ncbi:tRNA (adenosine(37)-N6)-threonylcarbamoyltransferase complex ATPase subunit type 1 TsaE [Candidatus Saccharibacteria bacterium QS_5_54_17]|nr:MAG: tRNA (adenosine(37)-N6)-threonylcarbamoyltransferase complex ATPase subunit type 1 TsaE [Candidatus Saccharibacteria bacterium QS_5_54_17]